MSKSKKLLKDIAYMFTGSFASKFLSFLLVPLYTSVLTTEEYGICDLIFTSVALLLPLFTLVIYEPMLRFSLEEESDKQQILSIGFSVGFIGFLLLLLISPTILLIGKIRDYYWYCIAYYFVYMLYMCMSYYVRGIGRVRVYTITGVVNTISLLALNILFLLVFKIGIVGYLLSHILSNLIAVTVAFFSAKLYQHIDLKRRPSIEKAREMLRYSIPLIPNSVSWWISNSSDRYMVSIFAGIAANGIYSVAYKIPTIVNSMATIINAAWQLSAVKDFGSEESKTFYSSVYSKFMSVLLIVGGIVILFTKQIAMVLYRSDFFVAWRIVPILTLAVIFSSMGGFVGTIFTSAKQTKQLMTTTLIGAGANILLNLALIPSYAGYGAAVATLISYFAVFYIRLRQSKNIMQFKRETAKDIVSIVLLCVEATIICLDLEYGLLGALLCYLLALWMRRSIFREFGTLLSEFTKGLRSQENK